MERTAFFNLITAFNSSDGRVVYSVCLRHENSICRERTCFWRSNMVRRKTTNRSVSSNRNQNDGRFNELDRLVLNEINESVKEMKDEVQALKSELNKTKEKLTYVKSLNTKPNQAINLNINKQDELEQYNRRKTYEFTECLKAIAEKTERV